MPILQPVRSWYEPTRKERRGWRRHYRKQGTRYGPTFPWPGQHFVRIDIARRGVEPAFGRWLKPTPLGKLKRRVIHLGPLDLIVIRLPKHTIDTNNQETSK